MIQGIKTPRPGIVAIDLHRGHLDMAVATMPLAADAAARVVAANEAFFSKARAAGIPVFPGDWWRPHSHPNQSWGPRCRTILADGKIRGVEFDGEGIGSRHLRAGQESEFVPGKKVAKVRHGRLATGAIGAADRI